MGETTRLNGLLKVDNLSKRFGSLQAVNDMTLSIETGKITGLIGPNGAGKTTLFNLITGGLNPDSGKIVFNGKDITHKKPYQIARMGIGRSWQLIRIFAKMTVLENLMIAENLKQRNAQEYAMELLDLFGLTEEKGNYAGELSVGQQKMLSIARILMLDAELMLLDELAAGVNPPEQDKMMEVIHTLCDKEGKTFFIIEHDMDVIMGHCDRVICMNFGEKIAEGSSREVQNNEEVIEAYFGG
jgi:branched-chain amino acid transport system ATP-binding protein